MYRDTFAEVLRSGVVETPPKFASESGSEKGVFSERGLFIKVHFPENLENLEILENLQTVENKGESDHFLEILEILPAKR